LFARAGSTSRPLFEEVLKQLPPAGGVRVAFSPTPGEMPRSGPVARESISKKKELLMRPRVFRLHKWVWKVACRLFPWMFRVNRKPVVNDPFEQQYRLRHRPMFLELERRKAPTSLAVAGAIVPPIALLGEPVQTPPAQPQASTLDRVERGQWDGADGDAAAIQLIRPPLADAPGAPVESSETPDTFEPSATVITASPAEELAPQLVDQVLSANYLQALPAAEAPFQDALPPDSNAPGEAPQPYLPENHGGGGGSGGGAAAGCPPSRNVCRFGGLML
jgi:hypothetical protein